MLRVWRVVQTARGGVIGINFYDLFLMPPGTYRTRPCTLADLIAHIKRICDLAGNARTDLANRHAWANRSHEPEWYAFVARASLRQLLLFGFPPPGHPFWNAETLASVAQRYPGLDSVLSSSRPTPYFKR